MVSLPSVKQKPIYAAPFWSSWFCSGIIGFRKRVGRSLAMEFPSPTPTSHLFVPLSILEIVPSRGLSPVYLGIAPLQFGKASK